MYVCMYGFRGVLFFFYFFNFFIYTGDFFFSKVSSTLHWCAME